MTDKDKALLTVLERGTQMAMPERMYNRIVAAVEFDVELRAKIITVIGKAMGQKLGQVEYPLAWRRFLKRKDCPAYMKEVVTRSVNAYYPKLSLPEEENWVTFEQEIEPLGR